VLYNFLDTFLDSEGVSTKLENDVRTLSTGSEAVSLASHDSKLDYSVIARKNLFGELGTKPPPAQPTAKPVNNVSLGLIGTFISKGEAPYAIIEDSKKQDQEVFNLNESIFGEATLKAIFPDHVEILRGGQVEILSMDENNSSASSVTTKDGVAAVSEDNYVVEEAELDKALENLPLLLTQARAVPYFKDGKSIGLRMFAIRSGSLFEKIGLMNGDILKGINGNSLADISQAVSLFQKLKEERSINLSLERNSQDRDFKYQIK